MWTIFCFTWEMPQPYYCQHCKLPIMLASSQVLKLTGISPSYSPLAPLIMASTPFRHVTRFVYLGVVVQSDLSGYVADNLQPILDQFTRTCSSWSSLPLGPVGRINLIKIVYLTKFLYLFQHTPNIIPQSLFKKIDSTGVSFIWAGRTPRFIKMAWQHALK